MLNISPALLQRIHAHLEAGYPHEACGILLGEIGDDNVAKTAREVVLVKNVWEVDAANARESLRNRYLISPEDIARADRDGAKRGLDIIGFFHSHPDHPSRPSETDREYAWPVIAFLITTVRQGKAEATQCWVLRDDRSAFDEDPLVIA
jgi:proteasome lid subunit RPN8/RPN11